MKSGILLLNGGLSKPEFVKGFLGGDLLCVAADGGARHAQSLGLEPSALLGDMDSISKELLRHYEMKGVQIVRHPVEKDFTDLELGLRFLVERGVREAHLVGLEGGRIDHVIGAYSIFGHQEFFGVKLWGYEQCSRITRVTPGEGVSLEVNPGEQLSLIPLTERVSGVSLSGAKWNLRGAELKLGESRGLSNVVLETSVQLSVGTGVLMVVVGGRTL